MSKKTVPEWVVDNLPDTIEAQSTLKYFKMMVNISNPDHELSNDEKTFLDESFNGNRLHPQAAKDQSSFNLALFNLSVQNHIDNEN